MQTDVKSSRSISLDCPTILNLCFIHVTIDDWLIERKLGYRNTIP